MWILNVEIVEWKVTIDQCSLYGLVICGVPELGRVLALSVFGNCSVGPRVAAVGDHAGPVHRDGGLR